MEAEKGGRGWREMVNMCALNDRQRRQREDGLVRIFEHKKINPFFHTSFKYDPSLHDDQRRTDR